MNRTGGGKGEEKGGGKGEGKAGGKGEGKGERKGGDRSSFSTREVSDRIFLLPESLHFRAPI